MPVCSTGQLCIVTFSMDASLFYWPTLHSDLSNGCQLVLLANSAQWPFQWMPVCSTGQLCTVTFPMDASLFYGPSLHSDLFNGCQLVLLAILFFPHRAKHLLTLYTETMLNGQFFQIAQEKWRWFVISNFGWPAVTVNNCGIQIPWHEQLFSFKRTRK